MPLSRVLVAILMLLAAALPGVDLGSEPRPTADTGQDRPAPRPTSTRPAPVAQPADPPLVEVDPDAQEATHQADRQRSPGSRPNDPRERRDRPASEPDAERDEAADPNGRERMADDREQADDRRDPARRDPTVRDPTARETAAERRARLLRAERRPRLAADQPDAWRLRSVHLKRLGHDLTTGPVQARPLGPDYRLRPGDRVRIVTWGGVALNDVVLVDASGALAAPGFGAIPVAGKTQVEVQQLLTDLVRSHFKQAGASLGVEQPNAVAVTVAGEVGRAGLHNLPAGATLLEALAAAGGVRDQGSLRRIRVQPPGGTAETIDLYRVVDSGEASSLGALTSGAFIFVPLRGPEVQVFGAVRRPAAVELLPDQPLAEALRLAGGFAAQADPSSLRLVREDGDGQAMRQLGADTLAAEPAHDGDRLVVASRSALGQSRRTVGIAGRVRSPGIYAFEPGLTVARLVQLAGGALPDANRELALIQRQRAEAVKLDQGGGITLPVLFDLVAPVRDDTPLEPLDQLTIPPYPPRDDAALRVRVSGAVRDPDEFPLTPGLTAQQALLLANGVTGDAQLDQADLVRVTIAPDGQRTVLRLPIDLRAVLQGDPGPALQARDEIIVRTRNDQRLVVTITGQIANSGSFTVPNGTTVAQLLALAGGLTSDAFIPGVRLFRTSEQAQAQEYIEELRNRLQGAVAVNKRQLVGTPEEQDTKALQQTIAQQENELVRLQRAKATGRMLGIDFAGLIAGRPESDLPLQSGDRLEIPAKPNAIRVFGEVMNPGSLKYEPNLKVETIVARSGGYGQQADRRRVFVVRADGAVVATASSAGTEWDASKRNWVTTKLGNITLREGDTVIVPPDLIYKPSKLAIAKDITQILFQIAVTAATVVVISG